MNLIANGFHLSFLLLSLFFFFCFLNFFFIYRALYPSWYIVTFYTSSSPLYSYFLFCIQTCEKFTLVNYVVVFVVFCYAAQSFICVSWSGFCVYCASKVRFLPQLWLNFSPVMSVNIDKFAIPARYVAFEK